MTENETSSFRLGSGPIEDGPEPPTQEDEQLAQLQFKRLARRIRITALLLLLLMIAVFALGYWDLQGRFARQANTGNREIQNITAVFEDRLNQLDQKFAAIEKQFGEDFAKVDKLTVKLQKDMGQLKKNLDAIDLTGTMRKEQKALRAQMQKAFAPIKKDIDSLSENMGAFDKRIKDQMVPLEEKLTQTRNDLAALDKALKASTAESVNRDALSLEILKVKKAYQQQVAAETSALRKQTGILVERLERLEVKLRDLQRTPVSVPATGPASGTGIQEQNLQ
jgi:chromosome segregation ATPase